MALKPVAVECKEREEIKLYGLWSRSNVFSWESEWENMMMLYTRKSGDQGKRYVILENTDAKGNCDMFVGGHTPGDGTGEFTVPAGRVPPLSEGGGFAAKRRKGRERND